MIQRVSGFLGGPFFNVFLGLPLLGNQENIGCEACTMEWGLGFGLDGLKIETNNYHCLKKHLFHVIEFGNKGTKIKVRYYVIRQEFEYKPRISSSTTHLVTLSKKLSNIKELELLFRQMSGYL